MITLQILQSAASSFVAIGAIRQSSWASVGLIGDSSEVIDAHDPHAIHWLASSADHLYGAVRVCFHSSQSELPDQELLQHLNLPECSKYCTIGRLVVAPGKYTRGVGTRLARAAVAHAMLARPVGMCAVTVPLMTNLALKMGFTKLSDVRSHFVPTRACSVMFLEVNGNAAPIAT
jgi:hypothetical protein